MLFFNYETKNSRFFKARRFLIGLSYARFATQEMIDTAVEFIENEGFNVHFEKDISFREGQVAGSIAERIQSFNKLILMTVLRLFGIYAGATAVQILRQVDWLSLQKQPKWLIGFSDFTTFLLHAHQTFCNSCRHAH